MIELTNEMRAAVKKRMGIPLSDELDPWMAAAVEDVLALVERDYQVSKRVQTRCGAAGFDGITCQRSPGHDERHAWASDMGLVKW